MMMVVHFDTRFVYQESRFNGLAYASNVKVTEYGLIPANAGNGGTTSGVYLRSSGEGQLFQP